MNFIRSLRNFPGCMNGWKGCEPPMKNKVCMLTTVHQPYDTRVFHKEAKSLAKVHNVVLIAPDDGAMSNEVDGVRMYDPRMCLVEVSRYSWKNKAEEMEGVLDEVVS